MTYSPWHFERTKRMLLRDSVRFRKLCFEGRRGRFVSVDGSANLMRLDSSWQLIIDATAGVKFTSTNVLTVDVQDSLSKCELPS